MNFINSSIDVQTLSAVEEVSLTAIHPSYKKILRIEWLITTMVLMIIAAVAIFTNSSLQNSFGWMIIAAVALLISALHFASLQKSFPCLAYAIRDKDVIHKRGWIIRRVKVCPFNRIQNCSVQSGPLERKYGLATLIIYTAGASGADMRISGLLQEEADRLRYFILSKIHTEPDEAV